MTVSNHTPLPWKFVAFEKECATDCSYEVYGTDKIIPIMADDEYYNTAPLKEDAEFIVKACNAHYLAKDVCKWVSDSFDGGFQIPAHIVSDAREFLENGGDE